MSKLYIHKHQQLVFTFSLLVFFFAAAQNWMLIRERTTAKCISRDFATISHRMWKHKTTNTTDSYSREMCNWLGRLIDHHPKCAIKSNTAAAFPLPSSSLVITWRRPSRNSLNVTLDRVPLFNKRFISVDPFSFNCSVWARLVSPLNSRNPLPFSKLANNENNFSS